MSKRPTIFNHGPYCWVIKYLPIENEDHGKTLFDKKEIHIFTSSKDEATIRDTLLHELEHVICEDVFPVILKMDVDDEDKAMKIEESFVLLTTPRRMLVYKSNPELMLYILGE